MKKFMFSIAFFSLTSAANAQFDLGNILGKAGQIAGDLMNQKTELTSENIVGTWSYTRPAVILSSDNALKQLGGKVAQSTLENKLADKLKKVGITAGVVEFTFKEDSTFTATVKSRKISGTWTIAEDGKIQLKIGKALPVKCTASLSGETLSIVADTSFLLKVIGAAGNIATGSMKTIANLASSYKELSLGMEFEKKEKIVSDSDDN